MDKNPNKNDSKNDLKHINSEEEFVNSNSSEDKNDFIYENVIYCIYCKNISDANLKDFACRKVNNII